MSVIVVFLRPLGLRLLLGIFILAAGLNAGRIGLDRWLIPDIRKFAAIGKKENHAEKHTI